MIASALFPIALLLPSAAGAAAQQPERIANGVALTLAGRRLELRACRDDVVRVIDAAPGSFFARRSIATVADACRPTAFEVKERPDGFELVTKRLVARVRLPGGGLTFLDHDGRTLLAEKEGGGRTIAPAEVMGETTAHVRAEFEHNPDEAFYGLGAHQNGLMNYAGRDVDLYQLNIVDVVPFLVSSRGYGLLWDNTSQTKFGDTREPVHVPAANLYDADGRAGGLTGTYRQGDCASGSVVATRVDPQLAFGAPEDRPAISSIHNAPQVANPALHAKLAAGEACVTWDGAIEFEKPGDYDLMTFSNNGVRVWLDGHLLFGTWRQGWLPWWDVARLALRSPRERHPLRVEWHRDEGEGTLRLKWKTPPRSPYTSLWSEV
ncbi:MAG TPA: PA14 domain-containing protein, partial [Vicinamibacteria bacterium]|nr:PA14 domain-containing protein [Vicinamibacteria bacterium]